MTTILIFLVAFIAQGPPETVVLKAAPNGTVTLAHKAHTAAPYAAKCKDCHKGEKPGKIEHVKGTFHAPMAKSGVCVDCHQQAIAKGNKKAPAKCADCHKK